MVKKKSDDFKSLKVGSYLLLLRSFLNLASGKALFKLMGDTKEYRELMTLLHCELLQGYDEFGLLEDFNKERLTACMDKLDDGLIESVINKVGNREFLREYYLTKAQIIHDAKVKSGLDSGYALAINSSNEPIYGKGLSALENYSDSNSAKDDKVQESLIVSDLKSGEVYYHDLFEESEGKESAFANACKTLDKLKVKDLVVFNDGDVNGITNISRSFATKTNFLTKVKSTITPIEALIRDCVEDLFIRSPFSVSMPYDDNMVLVYKDCKEWSFTDPKTKAKKRSKVYIYLCTERLKLIDAFDSLGADCAALNDLINEYKNSSNEPILMATELKLPRKFQHLIKTKALELDPKTANYQITHEELAANGILRCTTVLMSNVDMSEQEAYYAYRAKDHLKDAFNLAKKRDYTDAFDEDIQEELLTKSFASLLVAEFAQCLKETLAELNLNKTKDGKTLSLSKALKKLDDFECPSDGKSVNIPLATTPMYIQHLL